MKTKLAIFDVDGTLYNGTLAIPFLTYLIKNNIFNKTIGEQIFDWHTKYKSGVVDKSIAVDEMYKLYLKGISGKNYIDIQNIAQIVWDSQKSNLFSFVPQLFKKIRNDNYKIIILTGGISEMASLLSDSLGVSRDCLISGQPEIINGKYNGEILSYPGSPQQKVDALNELINKQQITIDWIQSIGMGDDERDEEFLKLVGHPIAINPSSKLSKTAKKYNWTIVTEKNIFSLLDTPRGYGVNCSNYMKSPQDRLSIIIGQLNGIKKMMDKNEDCIKLITQLRASRSGIESVIDTIIADKFDTCMKDLKSSDKKLLINIKKYVTNN